MTSLKWFSLNGTGDVLSFTGNFNVAGDINFTGDLYQNGSLVGSGGGGGSSQWTSIFGSGIYYNGPTVGIGKTNPSSSYKLDVGGDINFDGNIYKNGVLFTGGGGSSLWLENAGELYTMTNVGLGTDNPANTLHVSNTSSSFDVSNGIRLGVGNNYATFNYVIPATGTEYLLVQSTKQGTGNNRNIALNPVGGFVGVGKTDPGYSLDVFGDINFTGDVYKNGTLFTAGGSGSWLSSGLDIYYNTGNVGIGTYPSASYVLQVGGDVNLLNNTDVYRIGTTEVLSQDTLGSTVVNSSLTSVGNLTDLTVDTDTLVVDDSTHRVGIGKTNPGYTLDVVGVVNATGGIYYNGSAIISGGSLGPTITGSSLESLGTLTNGVNIASGQTYKIDNVSVLSSTTLGSSVLNSSLTSVGTLTSLTVSGNVQVATDALLVNGTSKYVGIGTGDPKAVLHVYRTPGDYVSLATPGSGPDGLLMIGAQNDANMVFDSNEIMTRNNGATSIMYLNPEGGDVSLCRDSGYVGINTASPQSPLHVSSIGSTWSVSKGIRLGVGSDYASFNYITPGAGTNYLLIQSLQDGTGYNYNIALNPAGGSVGIGKTNPSSSYKLDVTGNINFTGSLYQNGVLFSSGASQWTTTGSDIYYTTGSVGIGTNNPSTVKLYVYGSTAGQYLTYLNQQSATGSGLMVDCSSVTASNSYYPFIVRTNGVSNALTVMGTGRVGVGTNDPKTKLEVAGSGDTRICVTDTAASSTWCMGVSSANTNDFTINQYGVAGTPFHIKSSTFNTGIGTTDPGSSKLYVNGPLSANGPIHSTDFFTAGKTGSNSFLRFTNGGILAITDSGISNSLEIGHTSTISRINNNAGNGLAIQQSGGYVGFGTSSPQFPFHVTYAAGGSDPLGAHGFLNNSGSGTSTGGGVGFAIQAKFSGTVHADLYRALSDGRIKTNIRIVDDGDALSKLRIIEPKTYGYIDTLKYGTSDVIGFIAQEVKNVLPEAVAIDKDFIPDVYRMADYDIDNHIVTLPGLAKDGRLKFATRKSYKDFEVKAIDSDHLKVLVSTESMVEESSGDSTHKNPLDHIASDDLTDDGKIFVYGYFVNDLHTIKKDNLWAINFAATQEIDRIVESQKQKIASLEAQVANQNSIIQDVQAENEGLTSKLAALEGQFTNLLSQLSSQGIVIN